MIFTPWSDKEVISSSLVKLSFPRLFVFASLLRESVFRFVLKVPAVEDEDNYNEYVTN